MKKILVVGMTSTAGGVESFLINYCFNKKNNNIKFDFLCSSDEKIAYEDKIKKNSDIFYITPKRRNPILHNKELKNFFENNSNKYIAIWANLNSLMNIDYLINAKKYGIKHIIIHSHNSSNMGGKVQQLLHLINRKRIGKIATDFWACSESAAEWFYPDNIISDVCIIKNAINMFDYQFDENKRMLYRKEHNIEDRKVIGNIGRLHFQKNQQFLLEVLKLLVKQDPNYVLVLIGRGPDYEMLTRKTKELKLQNNVLFMGEQHDIGGWLSAFDIFAFPSKFEGLSIVALEAQANGIPIIASSNAIKQEGLLNSNVSILLDSNVEEWANEIIKCMETNRLSISLIEKNFDSRGFNIEKESVKLYEFFSNLE